MAEREELAQIARDLRAHLEWMRESGVREVPAPPKQAPLAPQAQAAPPSATTAAEPAGPSAVSLRAAVRAAVGAPDKQRPVAPPAPPPAAAPRPVDEAKTPAPRAATGSKACATLEEIRADLGDCRRCKLCQRRKNIVFGVGSPKAELVFVGEGPGADEDAQGVPFVGAAGQLLTKMIEAMGFQRDDVYICNVVKCRPPGNRDPEPDEIEACETFLKAQLAVLKPKAIVTLGKFASLTLLREPNGSITRMRGTWRTYQGIPLMPTFHPSYLLRQKDPESSKREKKKVWEDLQQVMKVFGRTPPTKK